MSLLNNIKNSLSLKTLLIIAVLYLIIQVVFGFPGQIIAWDGFGYYLYLPYTFIYGDLKFADLGHVGAIVDQYENTATLYQFVLAENGNHVIKYPAGLAIMSLPFFLIGHGAAYLFGYPMDGFSAPYERMMLASNIFYIIIGFIYLRKLLKCFFNEKITTLVIIAVLLGTNYLNISITQTMMSHGPLFALYCMALFLTFKWHENPTYKRSITLGLLIGLMIIVRPVELLFLLIPIFWKVNSFTSFRDKYVHLISKEWRKLLLFSTCIIGVGFIQLIYWKHVTGDWLFYSYDNPGEGFEFLAPYTLDFLFSFRKGWFIYTPIMIFATIGIFYTIRKKYIFGIGIVLFFLLNLWVISSWTCWWYASSFSSRPIVQSYPVMALGLGALLTSIEWTKFKKRVIIILGSVFLVLNVFQTWQYKRGIITGSRMTKAYYLAVFGKTEVPSGAGELLLVERSTNRGEAPNDMQKYKKAKTLYHKEIISFGTEEEFVPVPKFPYTEITSKDHVWLKVSGTVTIEEMGAEEGFLIINAFIHKEKKYFYTAWPVAGMKVNEQDSSKIDIETWLLTPEVRKLSDLFTVEIWNRAKSKAMIENFKIESFEKK